jgi:HK97 family phage major capsid protein
MRFDTQKEATNEQLLESLVRARIERFRRNQPVTQHQLVRAVREVLRREQEEERRGEGRAPFSFSKAIRGMMAERGQVVDSSTAESDVAYTRALASGSAPGSYLAPILQADAIISQLQQYSVARAAGATIWNLVGGLKLDIPGGITAPQAIWQSQNSVQVASDPVLGQLTFELKSLTALVKIPLQLLRVSVPVFDVILSDSFALAHAEAEDVSLFSTATVSGGPPALLSQAGITTLNCQGSANGGNLGYSDILAVMLKASQLKMKPPFAWFCSPRTLYSRLLALQDNSSRPLLIPDVTDPATSGYSLMGYPLYVTTSISEVEALGSGTNQSHLCFCTPRSIHIAQDHAVEMQVALEAYFDSAQAGLRITHQIDTDLFPPAALVVLQGIN